MSAAAPSGPAVVAYDAGSAARTMPHGSGIYARRLLEALTAAAPAGIDLRPLEPRGRGPEVVWEQLGLPRALARNRARLVHGPDSFLPLRRPCPGVVTIHDLAFERLPRDMPGRTGFKYRALVPRAARGAERVICPSRFTADDVAGLWSVPADRIRVIPEAAALAAGDAEPPPGPYVLAVGDLRPKKNLGVLVQAHAILRERDEIPHRLVLAGADAGAAAELRQAVREPADITGHVSDSELDALLRGADALVVPSLYEGFGLVVLDAMTRGCPTVLADAGALPETGGDAAAYFQAREPEDLAAVLGRLLVDPSERERLGVAGRARAASFTWQACARATLAVYQELLA